MKDERTRAIVTMLIILAALLAMSLLWGCLPDRYQPKGEQDNSEKPTMNYRKVVTGMAFETIGQVEAYDPDGDMLIYEVTSQDIPGMFGITADGFLMFANPELIQQGIFKVTVKATEAETVEKYSDSGVMTIQVTTDGMPTGCDTIIMQLDSVWIPGYWKVDTTLIQLIPSCWDTIYLNENKV